MPKTALKPSATVVDNASATSATLQPSPTVSPVSEVPKTGILRSNGGRFLPGTAPGPGRTAAPVTPQPNFRQQCREFIEMNWETIKLVAIARPQVLIEIMRYGHGPSTTEYNSNNEAPALALQLILQLQQHIDPVTYSKIVEAATKLLPQPNQTTTIEVSQEPVSLVQEEEESDAEDGSP
jgi:hypothetical protein